MVPVGREARAHRRGREASTADPPTAQTSHARPVVVVVAGLDARSSRPRRVIAMPAWPGATAFRKRSRRRGVARHATKGEDDGCQAQARPGLAGPSGWAPVGCPLAAAARKAFASLAVVAQAPAEAWRLRPTAAHGW